MHENNTCAQLRHLNVYQQNQGALCGFHMYFNAKCLLRAILAPSKYIQLDELLKMKTARPFWKHHKYCVDLLLSCTNPSFVSESDKKYLKRNGPLERSNLKHLLYTDPELKSLVYNDSNVAVFVGTLEHSFGLIHRTTN